MISGIVLAAGSSTRFGRTKQLEVVRGRPMARHAVDVLAEVGVDEILIVLGHDAEAVETALAPLPQNARVVPNPRHRDGQSTSLAAALHAVDPASEGAVVLLADQPGVTASDVRALVNAFRANRARITRLRYRNSPGPALLSREIYDLAGHLRGDTGARTLIASHPDWVQEVPIDEDAPPDVDTLDDLERA